MNALNGSSPVALAWTPPQLRVSHSVPPLRGAPGPRRWRLGVAGRRCLTAAPLLRESVAGAVL
jgi:hypothetical protein